MGKLQHRITRNVKNKGKMAHPKVHTTSIIKYNDIKMAEMPNNSTI
jgi:hypothetical protein